MNAGENNDLKEGMKKAEEDDQYFLIPPTLNLPLRPPLSFLHPLPSLHLSLHPPRALLLLPLPILCLISKPLHCSAQLKHVHIF